MKKIIIVVLLSTYCMSSVYAQGIWEKQANFPGIGMREAASFSIGTKGYVAIYTTGELWEFNSSNNQWTRKANLPAGIGFQPTTFVIGNKGYVGFGGVNTPVGSDQLWEYNPDNDSWIQKANIPSVDGKRAAFGFSIGTKGYVGGGFFKGNEFWEYDNTLNQWSQKNNLNLNNGELIISGLTFVLDNKGYLTGQNCNFYQYSSETDSWLEKPYLNNTWGQSFSIGNKGYVYCSYVYNGASYDNGILYEYDPAMEQWSTKATYPGTSICYPIGFSINNKGYLGIGGIIPDHTTCSLTVGNELWAYCDTCTITGINKTQASNLVTIFPNPCISQTTLLLDNNFNGASLTVYNCFGQTVKQFKNIYGQSMTLSRDNLPSGLYFIQITNNNKIFFEKLVVHD